jgi:outer membrane lipoprotein carrier protein
MKNLLLAFLTLVLALTASAQYDPKALEILEAMGKKYKTIPAYETNFSCTLSNDVEKVNEEFKGKLTVKGDKFRMVLPEQEVINNGATIWTYLPDAKEVNIDNYDENSDDINPFKIYEIYKKNFKYLYLQEKTEGGVLCEEIDLVPEKKEAQYFKIKMFINKRDKTIQGMTWFDKGGNRYKYTITKFNPNAKVEDAFFSFDPKKYPGVEVIDLR